MLNDKIKKDKKNLKKTKYCFNEQCFIKKRKNTTLSGEKECFPLLN
jgi:hypothetical protein